MKKNTHTNNGKSSALRKAPLTYAKEYDFDLSTQEYLIIAAELIKVFATTPLIPNGEDTSGRQVLGLMSQAEAVERGVRLTMRMREAFSDLGWLGESSIGDDEELEELI